MRTGSVNRPGHVATRDRRLYAAKIHALREEVSGRLGYVPQTFPHFTGHTVDDSDELVRKMSRLLFTADGEATLNLVQSAGIRRPGADTWRSWTRPGSWSL